ncbi:phage transcriptional regulator AlpA [Burkholderia pseudomallei]|nr:phage transcriptional regulator AlpA [Burkholderia pseudomallei]
MMETRERTGQAILRRHDVERETGLARSTIYDRVKAGTFPAPIKIGAHAVGWRVADIDAWLEAPAEYHAPTHA